MAGSSTHLPVSGYIGTLPTTAGLPVSQLVFVWSKIGQSGAMSSGKLGWPLLSAERMVNIFYIIL